MDDKIGMAVLAAIFIGPLLSAPIVWLVHPGFDWGLVVLVAVGMFVAGAVAWSREANSSRR